jgi:hypothetical protein
MIYKIFNITEKEYVKGEIHEDREEALERCKELAEEKICFFMPVIAVAE